MHKNIKLLYPFHTNQIKSIILLQNTRCLGNGVFAHVKCIIFVILYIFVLNNNKNTTLKKHKKHKKIKKKH